MSKQFVAIVVACLIALFGIFAVTSNTNNTTNGSKATLSNNVMGKNTKKVTLVEYGDFQCPACGQYHPIVKQLVSQYENDIQFQFRNFPLQTIHPNARASARAAEAAGKQGKYWEMHNMLYEKQSEWTESSNAKAIFQNYAKQLNLNSTKFDTDFASDDVNSIISADYNEGVKLGVNATPSFFVQGKKIQNPQTLDEFKKVIDDAIKAAAKK